MNILYYKVLPFIVVYFLVCDSLCAQSGEDSAPGSCPFFDSTLTQNEITVSNKVPYIFKEGLSMIKNITASPQSETVLIHGSLEDSHLEPSYNRMTACAYNPSSADKLLETEIEVSFHNHGKTKKSPHEYVKTTGATTLIERKPYNSALDINQTGTLSLEIDDIASCVALDSIVVLPNSIENEDDSYAITNHHGAFSMANVALQAIDDRDSTTVNTPVVIDVLANDEGLTDCSPTPSIIAGLAHGTAQIVDNKIKYTPFANYTGSDSLFYEFDCDGEIVSALVRIVIMPIAVFITYSKTICANMGDLPVMQFTGNQPFTVVYKEDGVQKTLTDYTESSFQTVAPTGEKKTYIIISITDDSGITNPTTDTLVILSGVDLEVFPLNDQGLPVVISEDYYVRIPERDLNGVPVENVVFPLTKANHVDILEISTSSAKDNLSQEVNYDEVVVENYSLTPTDNGAMMLSFNADDMPDEASRTIEGHKTLRPGYAYMFFLQAWQAVDGEKSECAEQRYFHVLVVPDTIVWRPAGAEVEADILEAPARRSAATDIGTGEVMPCKRTTEGTSWLYDNNWKHQAYPLKDGPVMINGQEAPITNGFAPLRETHVILPVGSDIYPILLDRSEDLDDDQYFYDDPDKQYLQYQYNFVHNRCKVVHFKFLDPGTFTGNHPYNPEIGRPDRLTYDSARVDAHLQTQRWYGLSAPLNGMFTGDYMQLRANPSVEIRFHKQPDQDLGGPAYDSWSTEFTSTVAPLTMGQGFAWRASRWRFPESNFKADPDEGVISLTDVESVSLIDYYFPVDSSGYNVYDAAWKNKIDRQELSAGEKNLLHRFIFDKRADNYLTPFTPEYSSEQMLTEIPLDQINLSANVEGQNIVIGNPIMSHFDFPVFQLENEDQFVNEYKFLVQSSTPPYSVRYVSCVGLYDETADGKLNYLSSDDDDTATDHAISPMQSFIVTTKSTFDPTVPLKVPVDVSHIDDDAHSSLRSPSASAARNNIMHIGLSRDGVRSSAVVAVRSRASFGYRAGEDSRLLLSEFDNGVSPSVYTEADGRALDINQLPDMPASLPVNILTTKTGRMEFEIKGAESMDCASELRFRDVVAGIDVPLQGEPFCYGFDNTTGNIEGRFSIARSPNFIFATTTTSTDIYCSEGRIHALAANNNIIRSLITLSLDGRILAMRNNIDNVVVTIDCPAGQQAVVVKIVTDRGTEVKKLICDSRK
jgi:hypothetical protein